jgi:hypothetical protein
MLQKYVLIEKVGFSLREKAHQFYVFTDYQFEIGALWKSK